MEQSQEHETLAEFCNLTVKQLSIAYSREDEDDDDESDWKQKGMATNLRETYLMHLMIERIFSSLQIIQLDKKTFFSLKSLFLVAKIIKSFLIDYLWKPQIFWKKPIPDNWSLQNIKILRFEWTMNYNPHENLSTGSRCS